ncbi:hypothetical protein [Pseudomonas sp. ANT_H12B]|uniref:hypothetical protein n=1 Tax=Pseudomonas sp. ANT_H12B TaxID=2597348 RepID=UPI0011EE3D45|nr:hypothetical protein [Pseudomonas sp. ANT_H12B]KAA0975700.1 hypothetical protein FQ185_09490 [Pseudomonas sp. ANT_H12B]
MYQVKGGKPKILLNARILKDTRMEDVHSEINRLVNICGRKRLSKNLAELVQYEKCRLVIPSYFRTMEEISRSVAFETSSTERCIEMYKALIISQADEIECFVAARDEFERAIALNLLTDAKTIIENMHRDLGESLWWVKAKLILLFLVGNAEEMQAFCDEIQERTSNTSSAYYFNSLIWTTQSSAPYYNLQKIIAKAVDEFSTSKQKGNAWVLEALYFPMMFVENPSLVDMDLMQLFPVIDQYGVLTNYIYSQLCEGRQDPGHERFLRSILDDFSRVISDPQLSGFLKYIKEGDRGLECNVGTEILKAYESGRYSECIQIYVDGIRNIKNPISYLNMIAKAQLYAGIDLRLGYPLLDKTIKSLKEIYSLSSRRPAHVRR